MSTEKLLSKIEEIITNRRNIEDFSYEVKENGVVKFKWTMRDEYEHVLSFPVEIESEPDYHKFCAALHEHAICLNVDKIMIDIVRNPEFEGLILDTFEMVQSLVDQVNSLAGFFRVREKEILDELK